MNPKRKRSAPKNFPILIGFMLLLILGTTGCNLPADLQSLIGIAPEGSPQGEPATEALATFHVQIPDNTPPDQPVLLSVLDEVTGLVLNAKRYNMEATGEGEYVIGLPFPVGTTVKYRYSRRGDITAEEHTTDGRAVRYRMVQIDGPVEVQDVVSRWNDTRFEGVTGRISGSAVDSVTGNSIPGMLVTAGGAQAITTSDGSFLIEGLPPGTHTLVVTATDGSYQTFQQGARVAAESTTPAPIQLIPTTNVDVTFIVHVPEDTPPIVPIRIAGNLSQLGNSFADLSGGVNTLASRMPVLSMLPDGTYGVILSLPAGVDVQYKYTLGDGFWNAEHSNKGDWVVRQMVIPGEPVVIEDTIQSWHVDSAAPITFDVTVPGYTPPEEDIYIQFNPYGWTEPLPMWHLGGTRWAYILYSPLDMVEKLGYRYCRSGQCGHADDDRTPGDFTSGQEVKTTKDPQGIPDEVENWAWLEKSTQTEVDLSTIAVDKPYGQDFMGGVEFQHRFHPSWMATLPETMEDIAATGSKWLVLTPGWTFTRQDPPVLEPVNGQNPTWFETKEMIRQANRQGLEVALRPIPHFPAPVDQWWLSAPRDFSWWVSWFDRYQTFAIHFADLAESQGVKTIILGGDWMSPALPSGLLADGNPSGVPPDADSRYRTLIAKIREHFSGNIAWAFSFPDDVIEPTGFIQDVDTLYILWSLPLSEDPDPTQQEMQSKVKRILSTDLYALYLSWQLGTKKNNIVINLAYPSVQGGTTECLSDPMMDCIDPQLLDYPAPDLPLHDTNLDLQARTYNAMLTAISQFSWIDGVISRGYYVPTILHDKSTSIHGKPAEEVLSAWFNIILNEEQTP
jgi:hypothetical protein